MQVPACRFNTVLITVEFETLASNLTTALLGALLGVISEKCFASVPSSNKDGCDKDEDIKDGGIPAGGSGDGKGVKACCIEKEGCGHV